MPVSYTHLDVYKRQATDASVKQDSLRSAFRRTVHAARQHEKVINFEFVRVS